LKLFNTIQEKLNNKKFYFINNNPLFENSLNEISKAYKIGVDTEFNWRNTYYPEISLIQISTQKNIFIFDLISLKKVQPLKNIFNNKDIKKIFHSSRGDLSVLKSSLDIETNNLFDTQIAENFLENDFNYQKSYKDLVKNYFYVNLPKSETNSDWIKRPLSQNQIKYSADDVRYLIKIHDLQRKLLKRHNKMDLVKDAFLEEKKVSELTFLQSRLRRFMKKKNKPTKMEERIFIWREKEAMQQNVPPNKIFQEKYIKILSKSILKNEHHKERWIFSDIGLFNKLLNSL
jgi:ribonuclease D